MDCLLRDIRSALRTLRKEKAFTAIVISTLALAMGAGSTIYTMVHFSLLRRLPFVEPETIAFIWFTNQKLDRAESPWSIPDFVDLRERVRVFEDMAAITSATFNLTGLDEPVRVQGFRTTSNFFSVMGLTTVRGRGFLPHEDRPDGPRVAVVSYGSWQRRFGADPDAVGREIVLDDESYTVIGVLTPEIEVGYFMAAEIWTPLRLDVNTSTRDRRNLLVTARLPPGVTAEEAQAELSAAARQLEQQYPATNAGWGATLVPYPEWIMGKNSRAVFFLLVLTVAVVMLIACTNVAGLHLARSASRSRELAIRTALGAPRARIVRQLLTESVCLSLAAGALGLLLSHWAFALLVAVTRSREPFFLDLRIDSPVLLFTLAIALVAPLVFGLYPALRASRPDVNQELKEAGGVSAGGAAQQRFRRMMVAGEVSLALVLLIAVGLMLRSLYALTRIELGFEPDAVLTLRIDLPTRKYSQVRRIQGFFDQVLDQVRTLPGVQSTSLISHRPIVGDEPTQVFTIAGRPTPEPSELPLAATITVSPDVFTVLRIPVLRGRPLSTQDSETAQRVALISRATAERYWPTGDPLGTQIRLGDGGPWIKIVGVVGDVRNPDADRPPEPHIYLPHAQNALPAMALALRTSLEPQSITRAVRRLVWEVDPNQPVYDARTMRQILHDDFASSYALFGLLSYFSMVALGLATAGIYGVICYVISQRSREIGIRMALGARVLDILRFLLREGLVPVAFGTGLGIAGALGISSLLSGLVYGITSSDPGTFLAVTLLLMAVAVSAVAVPSVRASRMDPIEALRHE